MCQRIKFILTLPKNQQKCEIKQIPKKTKSIKQKQNKTDTVITLSHTYTHTHTHINTHKIKKNSPQLQNKTGLKDGIIVGFFILNVVGFNVFSCAVVGIAVVGTAVVGIAVGVIVVGMLVVGLFVGFNVYNLNGILLGATVVGDIVGIT